jgi:hypothetical protein
MSPEGKSRQSMERRMYGNRTIVAFALASAMALDGRLLRRE